LADKLGPQAEVTGITLSPNQVKRGTELAEERGLKNAKFMVMNALEMDFPDNSFDIVWACESGEHMPDKEAYINEMMRVLKPGGKFVMATWCQRDDRLVPFDKKDKRDLRFLYEEWYVQIEGSESVLLKPATLCTHLLSIDCSTWNCNTQKDTSLLHLHRSLQRTH
jgi:MPBQ/MSBQ methyltransferase